MLNLLNNLPCFVSYIAGAWIVMTCVGLTVINLPGTFSEIED